MKVKKILVSQPKPETGKSPYLDLEEKYNVKVNFRPFIKVDPICSREFRGQKVNIAEHTAIVFTSIVGIKHFFRLAEETRVKINDEWRYFCISPSVANYLQKYINYRKRKVFFPETGRLADMFALIDKHAEEKFLVVLPDNNNEEVIAMLDGHKVNHSIGLMYRTVSNDFTPEEKFDYDMLLFFSPAGINSLMKNFPNFEQKDIAIGCFGPATAKAVKDAGLRLDLEAPTVEAPSMTAALDKFIGERNKD